MFTLGIGIDGVVQSYLVSQIGSVPLSDWSANTVSTVTVVLLSPTMNSLLGRLAADY